MANSGGGARPEGGAKAIIEDQICQAVQSTSNLIHLMQESSPSQGLLVKLPKNVLAKAPVVKNTGHVLELLPHVISSLDAYMESSLQSAPHVKIVSQLLSNLENTQLKSAFQAHQLEQREEGGS
ncbi:hypothetical protein HPP92_026375 [Vanilla planifolia]|uniref:Tobamovirus multiplication protein 2B n=1 Tax=Vanilla planifolia TaxID=51239 RepID=A0A835PHJ3_VANPL|nr:hypothetical protein HPP92_026375 [Vanilla planifolia]